MGHDPKSSRRALLKLAGTTGAVAATQAAAFPAAASHVDKRTYPRAYVANWSRLRPGDVRRFNYPDDTSPALIVRFGRPVPFGAGPDQDLVAYSTICPHMGCRLPGDVDDAGVLGPCGCHFSCFDLSDGGALVQGQATTGLARVVLETEGEEVFAVAIEGQVFGRHSNLEDPSDG